MNEVEAQDGRVQSALLYRARLDGVWRWSSSLSCGRYPASVWLASQGWGRLVRHGSASTGGILYTQVLFISIHYHTTYGNINH